MVISFLIIIFLCYLFMYNSYSVDYMLFRFFMIGNFVAAGYGMLALILVSYTGNNWLVNLMDLVLPLSCFLIFIIIRVWCYIFVADVDVAGNGFGRGRNSNRSSGKEWKQPHGLDAGVQLLREVLQPGWILHCMFLCWFSLSSCGVRSEWNSEN